MYALVFCVVFSCVDKGFAMDRSRVGVLPKCLNEVIASEVSSESEQARGSNP